VSVCVRVWVGVCAFVCELVCACAGVYVGLCGSVCVEVGVPERVSLLC
jgi:hypothetical protein